MIFSAVFKLRELRSGLNMWPHADQLRSVAAVVACADSKRCAALAMMGYLSAPYFFHQHLRSFAAGIVVVPSSDVCGISSENNKVISSGNG